MPHNVLTPMLTSDPRLRNKSLRARKHSLYVCNSKKCNKLFIPSWNGIAASVRCLSSTLVILNAKLLDYLRRMQTKEDGEKRRNPKTVIGKPVLLPIYALIWLNHTEAHMTHSYWDSYDSFILRLIWLNHTETHMTHSYWDSYDSFILRLIWFIHTETHMTY